MKSSQVYLALVVSYLRYGNLPWGHLTATKLHNLQKLKDRAINPIQTAQMKNIIPIEILSGKKSFEFDHAVMVHKILNEQCSEVLKHKFPMRSQVSQYEARRMNDLDIPRPRLEITRKSFY